MHEDIQKTFTGLVSATNTTMDTKPTLKVSADTYTFPVAQFHQDSGVFSQICFFSSCLSDLQSPLPLPQPTYTGPAADTESRWPCCPAWAFPHVPRYSLQSSRLSSPSLPSPTPLGSHYQNSISSKS